VSARLLVVDDEAGMRKSLAIMLRREGYDVTEAAGGAAAAAHLEGEAVDLVITDLRMGGVSGLDLLRLVKQMSPEVEVIVMTAYGTIEVAVEAMKSGAFDFVTKPFQLEEILHRVRNALERRRLRSEVHRLRSEATAAFGFDGIIGVSPAIRRVTGLLSRAAQSDSTVLLTGDSGTGKELAARALHAASRRAAGPFVSVSCAAFPETLLEPELFGHVKGAFTGALAARTGLLEAANGGTFLLDEVGEASPTIQTKLLRVLEERTIRRVGDNRSVPVDVRLVAATNRDLEAAIAEKQFRTDLFYRLNVIRIHLPPLRERVEDIPLLARHFLACHGRRQGRETLSLSPEAMEILRGSPFPGNVRELSNVIEQAVALATGPVIEAGDLPERLSPESRAQGAAPKTLADLERNLIVERIQARGGNLNLVAEDLGFSRTTLWRRMKEYQIETDRFGLPP
jgi:two-component system response regulator HydG